MKRQYCTRCERPLVACICKFTVPINNQVFVVILQHPTETKRSKATVPLLTQSLSHIEVIVGERFDESERLKQIIADPLNNTILLYPDVEAQTFNKQTVARNGEKVVLILIDGTWKKAYKLYQLSTILHHLPRYKLSETEESRYAIRKTSKKQAFSTLEACCFALRQLENNHTAINALLNKFEMFNKFQLSFVKPAPETNN